MMKFSSQVGIMLRQGLAGKKDSPVGVKYAVRDIIHLALKVEKNVLQFDISKLC